MIHRKENKHGANCQIIRTTKMSRVEKQLCKVFTVEYDDKGNRKFTNQKFKSFFKKSLEMAVEHHSNITKGKVEFPLMHLTNGKVSENTIVSDLEFQKRIENLGLIAV